MFKNLFLVATVLAPSSLLLAGPKIDRVEPNNICYALGTDYERCIQARATCFWDEEDGRCEPLVEPPGCGRIHNRHQCNNSPMGCFWDDEDGRCERLQN